MTTYTKTSAIQNVNVCVFSGNPAAVNFKYTDNGRAVLSFKLAVNDDYKTEDGVIHERCYWPRFTAWGNQAEGLNKIMGRAKKVTVTAKLTGASAWVGQDGKPLATPEFSVDRVEINVWKEGEQTNNEPDMPEGDMPF